MNGHDVNEGGLSAFEVEIVVEKLYKGIKRQVLITFWQNLAKQEVKPYVLRFINFVFLFGIKRNCSGRGVLLYLLTR